MSAKVQTLKDNENNIIYPNTLTDAVFNRNGKCLSDEMLELTENLTTEKTERQTEVAVERARIDTFVALEDGSTTGDAELIDIRVKVDGTTATTAGNAVREQVDQLFNEIANVDDNLTTSIEDMRIYAHPTIERGQISTGGNNVNDTASTMIRTKDYIPTSDIDTIEVLESNMMVYYFYYDLVDGEYIFKTRGNKKITLTVDKNYSYIKAYIQSTVSGTNLAVSDWEKYVAMYKEIERVVSLESDINSLKSTYGFSEKTKAVSYTLEPYGLTTSGTKGGALNTQRFCALGKVNVGDTFRISINDGYVMSVAHMDKKYYISEKYHICQRMINLVITNELINASGELNISFSRVGGLEFDEESEDNMNLIIEKVLYKNPSGEYDMIVASSDATEEEKRLADLVCDGVNDEIEIECALNCNVYSGHTSNVLLLGTNFYVGTFRQCYIASNTIGRGKNAITVKRSAIPVKGISGYRYPYAVKLNGQAPNFGGHGRAKTTITVTEECYNSIPTVDNEYAIIGAIRKNGTEDMGEYVLELSINLENVIVSPYGLEKPICGVDGCGFTCLMGENLVVRPNNGTVSSEWTFDRYNMPVGSIGIRLVHGSNAGTHVSLKHCYVGGVREGLSILGEHIILEDVAMARCYYGFTIGNYPTSPKMEHPIIMIGCSVEKCYQFAQLNRFGATVESEVTSQNDMQTLIYIGGSTESDWTDANGVRHETLQIKEVVKGAYRGRFETDWMNSTPIFESGSGKNLEIRNTCRKTYGALSSDRPASSTMDENARFVDTENNKLYIFINGAWREI